MIAVGQVGAYGRVSDPDSLGGRQEDNGGMGWVRHSGQGECRGKGCEQATAWKP